MDWSFSFRWLFPFLFSRIDSIRILSKKKSSRAFVENPKIFKRMRSIFGSGRKFFMMFLFFFLMLYVIDVSRDTLYSYAMGRKKEQEPCLRDSKDFYQRVLKLTIILHDVQHFRFQTNKTKNDRRSWRRSSVNFNERMGKFDSIRKDIQLEKQSPFLTVRVSLIFLTSHSEYLRGNTSYPLLHRLKITKQVRNH